MYPYKDKTKGLTQRQNDILGFLKDFIEGNGFPPSLREICVTFGIKSPKNARKHLDALEKNGFIRRRSRISRGIEVIAPVVGAMVQVPIAGRVKAGEPHLAIEDITGHVALDAGFFDCKGAFILKAEGESMVEAGIGDGDYLLIKPGNSASDNDIVIASMDGEATVKRFLRRQGAVILKPENSTMKPIVVKEGGRELLIIGKVVSVIKHIA